MLTHLFENYFKNKESLIPMAPTSQLPDGCTMLLLKNTTKNIISLIKKK